MKHVHVEKNSKGLEKKFRLFVTNFGLKITLLKSQIQVQIMIIVVTLIDFVTILGSLNFEK